MIWLKWAAALVHLLYLHTKMKCYVSFTTWTTCFCIHTARLGWKVQFWASAERDGASTPEASAVSGKNYAPNYVGGFTVTWVICSSRPLPLELTAVGETVVMENLEIFRMNGFQFQIDMEGNSRLDWKAIEPGGQLYALSHWLVPSSIPDFSEWGHTEWKIGPNGVCGVSVSNCKYSCVHS